MEQPQVQLKRIRDFGEVYNDAFTFIRQEIKPLGMAVLKYAFPWMLVTAILGVIIGIKQQQITNGFDSANPMSNLAGVVDIYKYLFLSIIVNLIGMSALQCIVISYIKLYAKSGHGNLASEDVWNEARQYILPVILISILMFLLIFVGFMLCVIPGIFLGVSLFAILYAYIIEEKRFGDAFNRSIKLTGQKWWMTLGLILITVLILYVIQILISIPSMILGFKELFFNMSQPSVNLSTGFYIMNSITALISFVIYSMLIIIMAFHYYSLVEMKERPSLQEKIDNIG